MAQRVVLILAGQLVLAIAQSLSGISQVHLDQLTGPTNYLASGILLGIPLDENQIPDSFFSEFGLNHIRSGGSQLPAPARGWTRGEFQGRYDSLKADYHVVSRHGGAFQIMIHDMWGNFDNFLDTFFTHLQNDGITGDNIYWDLWNEVDNVDFLDRGLDRWLDYWGHAYHKIKNEFPNAKVTGPSYGHLPNFAGSMGNWFSEWANFVQKNQSFPNMISLHFLYPNGDLDWSIDTFNQYLLQAGIDYQGVWNVQEYGNPDQLYPSCAAWNIAQLERYNAIGLRANWEGGFALHDYAANLLSKPSSGPNFDPVATGYYGAREFPVYQYYRQKMQGTRVATTMTPNTLSDSFAVISSSDKTLRILAGGRPDTGEWAVQINSLSSLGLPTSGEVNVRFIQFNSAPTLYDQVAGPTDLGSATWGYSGDTLTWTVYQNDPHITWAFELMY